MFTGFTGAEKDGPYDANPLRDTAEEAAADATPGQEVRQIRFHIGGSEHFVAIADGDRITDADRHLDYHRAQAEAAAAGTRVRILVPKVAPSPHSPPTEPR